MLICFLSLKLSSVSFTKSRLHNHPYICSCLSGLLTLRKQTLTVKFSEKVVLVTA